MIETPIVEKKLAPAFKAHSDKLIVALDYEEPQHAMSLVDELGDQVSWYKIGPVMFTRSGTEIMEFLHSRRKRIFLDLKLYDTPKVVQDTVKQLGDLGVEMATVHCLGGAKMLEAAAIGCRASGVSLLGVTLLTSQTGSDLQVSRSTNDADLVSAFFNLAMEHRLTGVLCSPHETAAVRAKSLPGFMIVNAGIRFPGAEVYQDDQKRVATPSEAVASGADYLIIGRPITQAREPQRILRTLFEGMNHAAPSNA